MRKPIPVVVVTGHSGAGKSSALNSLEDLGFYCVDNLPPALIPTFVDLCEHTRMRVSRAALVVDVRSHGLEKFGGVIAKLRERPTDVELLFLDAEDTALQQRFSETRRPHPLAVNGDVQAGIRAEREQLRSIRELADRIIDTTDLSPHDLRAFIFRLYADDEHDAPKINVTSFGFRSGLPKNADLVFDVRFLPNPNYISELKELTGMDKPVAEFVESHSETREFLNHMEGLLRFLLPRLCGQGRAYVTLAFGCTGGRHRSVAIASQVAQSLKAMGHQVSVSHRDIPEPP